MFVEDAPLNVGPKLLKGIARQESAEAFRGAQERVVRIGFAVNAPGVGDEVIPKKRHIPGIGGPEAAVVAPGDKREAYDIPDASLKGPVRHAKIARIFPEDKADPRFNGIPCDAAGHAHSIAVCKTSPMRPILFRPGRSRSQGGRANSPGQIRWVHRVGGEPAEILSRCE